MGPGISFISAGFPSPAEDFTELSISLDKHLIQNPAATFMAYANGNSMVRSGIHHGDILIIDRSLNARDGDIIIAVLHGEFTVKQLSIVKGILLGIIKIPPSGIGKYFLGLKIMVFLTGALIG